MPFRNVNARKKIKLWINHFLPLPLPHMYLRTESLERVVVIPNASGYMESVTASINGSLLVVDTGGFLPEFAGAFDRLNLERIAQSLDKIRDGRDLPSNARLFIPQSMARSLGWKNLEQVNGFMICLVADSPSGTILQVTEDERILLPDWLRQMILAVPLVMGQMIVFALGLIVYGKSVLLLGEMTLITAGLLVAACWKICSARGIIRGLLTGLITTIIPGVSTLFLHTPTDVAWKIAIGLLVCCMWMGIVFEGVRR